MHALVPIRHKCAHTFYGDELVNESGLKSAFTMNVCTKCICTMSFSSAYRDYAVLFAILVILVIE